MFESVPMLPSEFHDLGTRLRHARRMKRLTLKQLAQRAGCSESLVSRIETNRTPPSLRTLHRLAAALDTSISALFAEAKEKPVAIYHSGERPTVVIEDETKNGREIRLERLTPYHEGHQLDGNIHVVAPGADNGGEIKHSGEEIGYVLSGQIELTVGGTRHTLSAGDSFYFRSDLLHSYRNLGSETARIIWINTPPTF
jgi:transcriptional regulator with XRE-family HTH domain